MKELIYKDAARRAALHNEGDAVVAAIDEIKPVDAVPFDWLMRFFDEMIKQTGSITMEAIMINGLKRGIEILSGHVKVEGKENSNEAD